MRIALAIGAKPRQGWLGPRVRLVPGLWHFKVEGDADIVIEYSVNGNTTQIESTKSVSFSVPSFARVRVVDVKKDQYLTVIAVRKNAA